MSGLQEILKYASSTADDWTKTLDKVQRKTIQNRLAQRKRREKVSKSRPVSERDSEKDETVGNATPKEVGKRRPVCAPPFFGPETFPRSLGPTPLQLETYHHPFIDLIAPPGLRNNILVARLADAQEDDLCRSIHEDGLKVWGGQPWSPIGWEFSQSFVDQ
ncbi:MAG: hypothetical protein Q9210_000462 [Variospora velana]